MHLHHAYIYEGPLAQLPALEEAARELFGFSARGGPALGGNPDVQILGYEKFGIDEARELVHTAALKSISGRALYIVGVSSITTEAQQALLKLFEEPQEGVIFVLLAPHGSIIATLRSRFLAYPRGLLSQKSSGRPTLQSERAGFQTFAQVAQSFLQGSNKDRSAEIAKLLKDEDAVRERVRDFLNELEIALHSKLLSRLNLDIREGLEDIAKVRSYINDRSPSMKMLLEHLAVSLPRFDLKAGLSKVGP